MQKYKSPFKISILLLTMFISGCVITDTKNDPFASGASWTSVCKSVKENPQNARLWWNKVITVTGKVGNIQHIDGGLASALVTDITTFDKSHARVAFQRASAKNKDPLGDIKIGGQATILGKIETVSSNKGEGCFFHLRQSETLRAF